MEMGLVTETCLPHGREFEQTASRIRRQSPLLLFTQPPRPRYLRNSHDEGILAVLGWVPVTHKPLPQTPLERLSASVTWAITPQRMVVAKQQKGC